MNIDKPKKKYSTPWWKVYKDINDKKLDELHPDDKEERPVIKNDVIQ